ncbi:MAG: hypothetical protein OXF08_11800 [Bacteroidetes bacterium]|nr:hypothetical protein [Bacteroidota bacterium]
MTRPLVAVMETYVDFFRPLLIEAGQRAMNYFLCTSPEIKEDGSPVTAADRDVQKFLISIISQKFPNDGIIAEENEVLRNPLKGSRYWTIDPIDGTVPFVAGMSSWGIAIGLIDNGQPKDGFIYIPSTGDLFYTKGERVWRNAQPTLLSADRSLDENSIMLTHARPHQRYTLQRSFPGRVFGLGTASAHLSLVATGCAELVLIGHDKIWDLAPGYAMLSANGGVLRYLNGEECDLSDLLDGRPAPYPMIGGHASLIDETLPHIDYWEIR